MYVQTSSRRRGLRRGLRGLGYESWQDPTALNPDPSMQFPAPSIQSTVSDVAQFVVSQPTADAFAAAVAPLTEFPTYTPTGSGSGSGSGSGIPTWLWAVAFGAGALLVVTLVK